MSNNGLEATLEGCVRSFLGICGHLGACLIVMNEQHLRKHYRQKLDAVLLITPEHHPMQQRLHQMHAKN